MAKYLPVREFMSNLNCIELCAGAGGQALGLEKAGFKHLALADIDAHCCQTLRVNRPLWNVAQADIRDWTGASKYRGHTVLLAGGLPCPPFSVAGKQLGKNDERDLFPAALRLINEIGPKAVMIENVRGILDPVFLKYRQHIEHELHSMGYRAQWRMFSASDFGVPQLRPRVFLVALVEGLWQHFSWPTRSRKKPGTVGEVLFDLMASSGWAGAEEWKLKANTIAPTVVGGSTKHGGPDLGPTRAKRAWRELGVDGHGIADLPPEPDFTGMPRLTVRMVARLQGFPDDWAFSGRKTHSYRQVGNALPPPVAYAIARQIMRCLNAGEKLQVAV